MSLLIIKMLLSVGFSLLVMVMLSGVLHEVLSDLCPTQAQVNFWMVYSRIMLLLAPIWLVLLTEVVFTAANAYESIIYACIATLTGLLFALWLLGNRIFAPALEAR